MTDCSRQLGQWHHGDRIVHIFTHQRGIVYGWKLDELLIHWGTQDKRPIVTWEPEWKVMLDEQDQIPTL